MAEQDGWISQGKKGMDVTQRDITAQDSEQDFDGDELKLYCSQEIHKNGNRNNR